MNKHIVIFMQGGKEFSAPYTDELYDELNKWLGDQSRRMLDLDENTSLVNLWCQGFAIEDKPARKVSKKI